MDMDEASLWKKERLDKVVSFIKDDMNQEINKTYLTVNVNIKMLKKWEIKMYIFQELFLSLCFHKGPFLIQTVWRSFNGNNLRMMQ